jgi:hypothetical protein
MIYVDDMLRPARITVGGHVVQGRWSHLVADDPEQLRWCGARLGLRRSWLRFPGEAMEHFLVTAGVRVQALADGVVSIVWRHETDQFFRASRSGGPFDLDLLRAGPARRIAGVEAGVVSKPRRLQLSRGAGFRLPANSVSVAGPSRWANPYLAAARSVPASQAAVEHFAGYLRRNPGLIDQARAELTGRDLACWCAPHLPCHADVWLAVVNTSPEMEAPMRIPIPATCGGPIRG